VAPLSSRLFHFFLLLFALSFITPEFISCSFFLSFFLSKKEVFLKNERERKQNRKSASPVSKALVRKTEGAKEKDS